LQPDDTPDFDANYIAIRFVRTRESAISRGSAVFDLT
jgi:hypothetical protein